MDNIFWSLLGFTPEVIKEVIKFKNKIKITPSNLQFMDSSDWTKSQSVVVCNKTDNPIFDVYLILFSQNGESNEFSLNFKNLDQSFEIKLPSGIIVNTQFLIFNSEANGKFFKTLKISRIMPNSCITLDIIPNELTSLKIEAIKFSKTPSSIALGKDGQIALQFVPLYNIKLLSASFILRRE